MPVRNVSAVGFTVVTEAIDASQNAGEALTKTATNVDADTDVVNVASGADCTVQLDFTITKHAIGYGDRNTADSTSAKETRTVRQHEYAHVGARNALASSTLLSALCTDVGVNWKFHAPDQATLDATKARFEAAVEAYVNPIVDYLDELVVHETQRKAGKVGVKTDAQVAAMLAAISYTDPDTGKSRAPSAKVIAQAVTATKTGSANGETYAKTTATPSTVKPAP
jgi:hypothetical protein